MTSSGNEGILTGHRNWICTKRKHNNCYNIKKLTAMLLHQPHVDFAGIYQTPRELSSPPSAVCAAAEREGDTRRHDSDDI